MVGCGDVGGWSVFRKWFDCQLSCGPWPVNMSTDTDKCKYKLRQNKKMESDEGIVSSGPKKRGPKPRLRSAGMSRYRRKEANARERQRQGEINTSFDKLREKIPHPGPTNGKCEKLRKIDILHVAINYIRALENILESGEPGVHHFANSVYKVGRDEAGDVVEYGSVVDDGSMDSDYSEDSEQSEHSHFTQPSPFQQNFINQAQRSQRKITLTSRDDSQAAKTNLKQIKKPFSTHLLQPNGQQNLQYPSMQMNVKLEMQFCGDKINDAAPAGYRASTDQHHHHQSHASADYSKEAVQKWPHDPKWSDMSLLSDFSDMSSSDPEDIFLPDLSSSLESLHNIEAFNFFNEKQNLAF